MQIQIYKDTPAEMWRKVMLGRKALFIEGLLSRPSASIMVFAMPPMTEAEKSYARRYCGALLAHLDGGGRI